MEHIKPIIGRVMRKFTLTAPRPFIPTEFDEQVAVFDYAHYARRQDSRWDLLFATLNGVRLPIGLAVKAKRAGMIRGVPDLVLPVACGGWFGWFGEGKRIKGGHTSDAQRAFMQALEAEGYKVEVWRGSKNAIELITAYLALPVTVRGSDHA